MDVVFDHSIYLIVIFFNRTFFFFPPIFFDSFLNSQLSEPQARQDKTIMQDKDKDKNEVRLAVEFRVTAHAATCINSVDLGTPEFCHLIRSGCDDSSKIIAQMVWNVDKAITTLAKSTLIIDCLNLAMRKGWLVVSKINVDPTATIKLSFYYDGTGYGLASGWTEERNWSLEKYWRKDMPLDTFNEGWKDGMLRLSGACNYSPPHSPPVSQPDPQVSVATKVADPATTTVGVASTTAIVTMTTLADPEKVETKNKTTPMQDLNEEKVRLVAEFQVTAHGAASMHMTDAMNQDMRAFIRAGCHDKDSQEKIVHGTVWSLDKVMMTLGIRYLNQAIQDGWLVVTCLSENPRPAPTWEMCFRRVGGGGHFSLVSGMLDADEVGEQADRWSLKRFGSTLALRGFTYQFVLSTFNEAWKQNNIRLSVVQRPGIHPNTSGSDIVNVTSDQKQVTKSDDTVITPVSTSSVVAAKNDKKEEGQSSIESSQKDNTGRLRFEFQVTPAAEVASICYSMIQEDAAKVDARISAGITKVDPCIAALRLGCMPGSVIRGAIWKLDKFIESGGHYAHLDAAIRSGWLVVSKITVDPTSTVKLQFLNTVPPHMSVERFWMAFPATAKRDADGLKEINQAWHNGFLRLESITSYGTVVSAAIKIDAQDMDSPQVKCEAAAGIKTDKNEKKNDDIRIGIEFQVTACGAAVMACYPDDCFTRYLRNGCTPGKVNGGDVWKLNTTSINIQHLNHCMHQNWIVMSKICVDPTFVWKLGFYFGGRVEPAKIETQVLAMGYTSERTPANWCFERLLCRCDESKLNVSEVLPKINEAWFRGTLRLVDVSSMQVISDNKSESITPIVRVSNVSKVVHEEETKINDDKNDRDVRLRFEFQVMTYGDEAVNSTKYPLDDRNTCFIRTGCESAKVTTGSTWHLDKAIGIDVVDRLNHAIQWGWIAITRIIVDPTSTTLLHFRGKMDLDKLGRRGMVTAGVGWSFERFWDQSMYSTELMVKDINESWILRKIRLDSVTTRARGVPNLVLPTESSTIMSVKIGSDTTCTAGDQDKKHVSNATTTTATVAAAADVVKTSTAVQQGKVRLTVEFRVNETGAAILKNDDRKMRMTGIVVGCEPHETVVEGSVWKLDRAMMNGVTIDRMNGLMREGFLCISRVYEDPTSTLELGFALQQGPITLDCGLDDLTNRFKWSLDRFWSVRNTLGKMYEFQDAWRRGWIVLDTVTPRTTILPVVVTAPTESIKTADVPVITTTVTAAPIVSDIQLTTDSLQVKKEKETNVDKVQKSIVGGHGGFKMELRVNPHRVQGDNDPDMIAFLTNGCDGASQIWTWERAFQHVSTPVSGSTLFQKAITCKYLRLVQESPRLKLGPKGIEHCQERPIAYGPTNHFLLVSCDATIWVGEEQHRSRLSGVINSDAATMCRIALANYDAFLAMAIEREWLMPV